MIVNKNVVPIHRGPEPDVIWSLDDLARVNGDSIVEDLVSKSPYERLFRATWMHRPTLRTATIRLAEMITPKWLSDQGEPLLEVALALAGEKLERLTGDITYTRLTTSYLSGILSIHPQVASMTVVGQGEHNATIGWDYFSLPLKEWADIHGVKSIVGYHYQYEIEPTHSAGVKARMLSAITCVNDAGIMQHYFEKVKASNE